MKVFLLFLLFFQITLAQALEWMDKLWQTPDQIAKMHYEQGEYKQSAELFENKAWQAQAWYKAGEFDAAAKGFKDLQQHYNYANALTQQKQYQQALETYQKVNKDSHDYQDALHNLEIIKQLLKQQKQQQQQGKDQQKNQDDKAQKDEKQSLENQQDKAKKQQDEQHNKNPEKAEKKGSDKSEHKAAQQTAQQQIDKQRLEQIFKQVKTQPIQLLKQKFLIEQYLRKRDGSAFINNQGQKSW